MTVTKAGLAENLFRQVGLSKNEAKEFVDTFFEEIISLLANGNSLKFSGFGNFELRDKDERIGRNPKTGVEVLIKARRVVVFKPGQKLRDRVESYIQRNPSLED